MSDDPKTWLTAGEVATRFGVPLEVVRRLKYRKQLTPAGYVAGQGRGGKVALYDPDDIDHVMHAWRENPRRRKSIDQTPSQPRK